MKHVIAILDPAPRINQEIVLGLSEQLPLEENWNIHVMPRDLDRRRFNRLLQDISVDALVVRHPTPSITRLAESLSVPYIIVADEGFREVDAPVIVPDDEAVGIMAADYLLQLKFMHIGLVTFDNVKANGKDRGNVFRRKMEEKRRQLHTFELTGKAGSDYPFGGYGDPIKLVQWLKDLPKPCAILAHSDQPGAEIIRQCLLNDISVPEQVSVLGVDDDLLFCHAVSPHLASIHVPYRRIGIEAARLIQDWKPGYERIPITPIGVVERASCRSPRREDPLVDMALEHLRRNVAEGVKVRDLQKLTGLSSHRLLCRFQEILGCTPMEMILRHRLEVAKQLLVETKEPVGDLVYKCGFKSATQFYVTFRDQVGYTPVEYRERFSA